MRLCLSQQALFLLVLVIGITQGKQYISQVLDWLWFIVSVEFVIQSASYTDTSPWFNE